MNINNDEDLAKILNINIINQIKYIEGITWNKWNKYENKNNETIIKYIQDKFTDKYLINKYLFIRYKNNNNGLLLIELDIIIDRNIKILIISDGKYNEIIMAKTVKIFNDNNYQEFNPVNRINYDMNNDKYDTNEKILNLEIEYYLIYKILKEY